MAWKKTVRSRLNEETFCSSMKKKINASQESSTIAAPQPRYSFTSGKSSVNKENTETKVINENKEIGRADPLITFKNSNFSLLEFMKQNRGVGSHSKPHSVTSQQNSQISTPRLTPLKMLERNRNQIVSFGEINRLEGKIKDLESQIVTSRQRGEEKKLDKLEKQLSMTAQEVGDLLEQPSLLEGQIEEIDEEIGFEQLDQVNEADFDELAPIELFEELRMTYRSILAPEVHNTYDQRLDTMENLLRKFIQDQNKRQAGVATQTSPKMKASGLAEKRKMKKLSKVEDHLVSIESRVNDFRFSVQPSIDLSRCSMPAPASILLRTPCSAKSKKDAPSAVVTRSQKRKKGSNGKLMKKRKISQMS